MTSPRIGVLALQGDVPEHLATLERLGARASEVRRPTGLAAVGGLVVPGGESTTMMTLLRAVDLLEPLRQRIRDGMPVFGTCAGMILLADRIHDGAPGQETVGGLDVVVRRNAFGRQVESAEEHLRVTPAGEEPFICSATFIRAPWVEQVGEGVEVLARVVGAAHGDRIVAVRQGPLLATSFHPEVSGDPWWHELFVRTVARC